MIKDRNVKDLTEAERLTKARIQRTVQKKIFTTQTITMV